MNERGVEVDHSTMQRWVAVFIPLIEGQVRLRKKPVGRSWRMDETYIKVKGEWCYLYRAVDKEGNTIDFLLCKNRDTEAAKGFFKKAIENNGVPLKGFDESSESPSRAGPPLDQAADATDAWFQIIISAGITLVGIEIVRMIKKGQLKSSILGQTPIEQFRELFV